MHYLAISGKSHAELSKMLAIIYLLQLVKSHLYVYVYIYGNHLVFHNIWMS